MEYSDLITYFSSFTFAVIGILLGTLANKLILEKDHSNWKWVFYTFGIIAVLVPFIVISFFIYDEVEFGFVNSLLIFLCFVFGVGLLVFTNRELDVKNIFNTIELDPIINRFTEIADKNEIKLFGGDLNFFGEYTKQMDINPQYTKLRALQFRRILIICEQPEATDANTKIRYGKIISDLPNTEIRYYNPEDADLRVRGRILQVNGVNKLLMFTKIRSKNYKAIETDTANSNGALYNNIWDLVWSLAITPDIEEISSYINLYEGN